jgi:hypothetical protein
VNLASRALRLLDDPDGGYEPGFLYSFRLAIDEYLSYPNANLKIVVNAGGLNPRGLALKVQEFLNSKKADRQVAYVLGDNILASLSELEIKPLTESTGDFVTWKEKFPKVILANTYIGCWGIVRALSEGADIIICGRCTDASPVGGLLHSYSDSTMLICVLQVIGLAAWWHGWTPEAFAVMAGALAAGHLIECGCYVVSLTRSWHAVLINVWFDRISTPRCGTLLTPARCSSSKAWRKLWWFSTDYARLLRSLFSDCRNRCRWYKYHSEAT